MKTGMMRVARLHGLRDLRVEEIPIPEPAPGELLVQVEACGVCATDARKYEVGVNDGEYPHNPGHEWVGWVVGLGEAVAGWGEGERVYGDTYGGYAAYATIPVEPLPWSAGPTRLPADLPLDRAIFLEPLADCLHAVHDQARVEATQHVVVIAAGVMGLQIVAAARRAGAHVLVVEPLAARRELAASFGAEITVPADGWEDAVGRWSGNSGVDVVIQTIPDPLLVAPAIAACRPGGRVVLFAGFGDRSVAALDLNVIHYREITLVGSEWVGTPPNQRRERYQDALELLASGDLRLEQLVTGRCGFEELEDALVARPRLMGVKSVFSPEVLA